MINNILYFDYDKLKPKQKKAERKITYNEMLMIMLGQIVRVDGFEESLDLDLDIALNIKLSDGYTGITYDDGAYRLLYDIQPVGLPRKDGRPNKLNATYVNDDNSVTTKEYTNDIDCVLWYNNALALGESVDFFSYMMTEIDTSIEYNVQRSRYNPLLRVRNQKQKASLDEAMKNTHNGEPVTFVDDFDMMDLLDDNSALTVDLNDVKNIDKVQYLSHLHDDILKRFSNMYGVSMNMSSKQAQQTEKEISGMDAMSWLIPIDMLNQSKEFCHRMKKLYDVNLVAHFGLVHEFNFKSFTGDCTKNDDSMDDDIDKNIGEVNNGDSNGDLSALQNK